MNNARLIDTDRVVRSLNDARRLLLVTIFNDSVPSQRLSRVVAELERVINGLPVGHYDLNPAESHP